MHQSQQAGEKRQVIMIKRRSLAIYGWWKRNKSRMSQDKQKKASWRDSSWDDWGGWRDRGGWDDRW